MVTVGVETRRRRRRKGWEQLCALRHENVLRSQSQSATVK